LGIVVPFLFYFLWLSKQIKVANCEPTMQFLNYLPRYCRKEIPQPQRVRLEDGRLVLLLCVSKWMKSKNRCSILTWAMWSMGRLIELRIWNRPLGLKPDNAIFRSDLYWMAVSKYWFHLPQSHARKFSIIVMKLIYISISIIVSSFG
jgi:hypothetical protein